MNVSRTLFAFVALAAAATSVKAADGPLVLPLYPQGAVPGESGGIAAESIKGEQGKRQISNVSEPSITVYLPPKEKNTGAAIVITPGGGYNILAIDHEGYDVAKWLNSIGVAGIVLKYRIPKRPEHPSRPLMDAQRALGLVRANAEKWQIDPKRIGIMGFSAGGHLDGRFHELRQARYPTVDAADQAAADPTSASSSTRAVSSGPAARTDFQYPHHQGSRRRPFSRRQRRSRLVRPNRTTLPGLETGRRASGIVTSSPQAAMALASSKVSFRQSVARTPGRMAARSQAARARERRAHRITSSHVPMPGV